MGIDVAVGVGDVVEVMVIEDVGENVNVLVCVNVDVGDLVRVGDSVSVGDSVNVGEDV